MVQSYPLKPHCSVFNSMGALFLFWALAPRCLPHKLVNPYPVCNVDLFEVSLSLMVRSHHSFFIFISLVWLLHLNTLVRHADSERIIWRCQVGPWCFLGVVVWCIIWLQVYATTSCAYYLTCNWTQVWLASGLASVSYGNQPLSSDHISHSALVWFVIVLVVSVSICDRLTNWLVSSLLIA